MADSSGDWSTWIQGVAGDVASKWASKEYGPQTDTQQAMQLQALGQQGYYIEGKPGATTAKATNTNTLYIGAAVAVLVLVLVLKA
jgi:hypothetical protein